jgi:hypothetical protein
MGRHRLHRWLYFEPNNPEFPSTLVVRVIAAPCDNVSGACLLIVEFKDLQLIFDNVDSWFVHTCAGMISQMWQKHQPVQVMTMKKKFIQGFVGVKSGSQAYSIAHRR